MRTDVAARPRPVPLPVYTVALQRDEQQRLWCRVQLDIGQYCFGAGMLLKNPGLPVVSVAEATSRLMRVINLHGQAKGWFGPELEELTK